MTTNLAPVRSSARIAPLVTFGVLATFALGALLPFPVANANVARSGPRTSGDEAALARPTAAYGQLPLRFEENVGQSDPRVRFLARTGAGTLFLVHDEIVLTQVNRRERVSESKQVRPGDSAPSQVGVLRMGFESANPHPDMVGEDRLAGTTNYFVGADPERWRTDVAGYGKVRYGDVYPGVDVVYYGNGGQVEFDVVVAPGADPSAVALRYTGATRLAVEEDGALVLETKAGIVRQCAPVVYQNTGEGRQKIAGRYVVKSGNRVGFELGRYDRDRPLVIDPVLLVYSTYLGGTSDDRIYEMAVDAAGSAYVTGFTSSANFPTVNAFDTTKDGFSDVFVTKFSPDGGSLVYSTFLGGNGDENALGIAVDAAGVAYLAGGTDSTDFPTANAFDSTINGSGDAFVAKLGSGGNALIYSTYLGGGMSGPGANIDNVTAIAVDAAGVAALVGVTSSTDFPIVGAFDSTFNGNVDVFVAKLSAAGSSLVYSTYLGGSGDEVSQDIALDSTGAAYVTGSTMSSGFPTINALDSTYNGSSDGFVTKLSASGNTLVYSTFLAGSGSFTQDQGNGIVVDASGAAYVTGYTTSSDFPTANAYDNTSNGSFDAFVTKLSASGNTLVYSTYLGGIEVDNAEGIAIDASGAVYIAGETTSPDFPLANAYDRTLNNGPSQSGLADAFVTKLNAAGSALVYSTFLGGSLTDNVDTLAIAGAGAAYIAGPTGSTDFPTANAFDSINSFEDSYVAKLSASVGGAPGADTAGVYTPTGGAFFLRNSNSSGGADVTFVFGAANAGYVPLRGDWNGDGVDTPGLYDAANGVFFLRDDNSSGPADYAFTFGAAAAGYVPITGDWNGDGADSIGLYSPATGAFFLRNSNSSGPADRIFTFGGGGLVPLVGNWDGDAVDSIGLYDPATSSFFLRNSNAAGGADLTFGYGPAGATPIADDWDGDGTDSIGVYVPSTGVWFLRNSNTPGGADLTFGYGPANATPLSGDWDGL